jgi:hypothetical protein
VEVEFGLELETSTNSYSLTAPFDFGFGLTDWLEVAIKPSVFYVNDQEKSPRRVAGVGDLVLAKARLPFTPFDLDLAVVPSLKIPTADEDRGLGTGRVDGGALLVVSKEFTEAKKLHFNAGYTVTGKTPAVKLQDVLFIGLAGGPPFRASPRSGCSSSPKWSAPRKRRRVAATSRGGWASTISPSRISSWTPPSGGALPRARRWSSSPRSG